MAIPFIPSAKSRSLIVDYAKHCVQAMQGNWNLRPRLEEMDRIYSREVDRTREQANASAYNRAGDPTKFQNVTIPVVMPQVEQAVSHQHSVFLTGTPIFSCVSVPEFAEAANQLDTIFSEQEVHGNWAVHLLRCIRDGLKYNLMAAEVDWTREVTASVRTDLSENGGQEGKAEEVIWEGNKIRHCSLYNTFWDTRVSPADVSSKGEFAGYHEYLSKIAFKKFVAELPTKLYVSEAFASGGSSVLSTGDYMGFYFPQIVPNAFVNQDSKNFDWSVWAGYQETRQKLKYKDAYLVTTLYARILPSEFDFSGIPGQNTPQVWKFIIVNNEAVIFAEKLTNAHNLLPIVFAQILDDGLGYQTKGFSENLIPFQQIVTALANSSIAARRRGISDRKIFDPSRISPAAINNDNPSANIPVRPNAYGKPLSEAVYPLPFRDDLFQLNMAEMQSFRQMAMDTSGLNQARLGQFVKGNKTKFEYADVMANASGRDMTISLMLEGNFFTPIKNILKINVLQYQKPGPAVQQSTGSVVNIDPVLLRRASLVLKVTDGLTPSDKIIDGETLQAAVQTFTGVPELGAEYNVGDMVAHLFSSRGLKLAAYKKSPQQIEYERAVGQWNQTVQFIVQEVLKTGAGMEELERALAGLPQPTPEQFGYVPGTKILTPGAATSESPSLLQGMGEIIQNAKNSQTQAAQATQAAQSQEGTE